MLKEHHHGVPDAETNVAAVIVIYRGAAIHSHEAVPVLVIRSIKLFFDFLGDVAEVAGAVVLEGLQRRDDRMLLLVGRHFGAHDEYLAIGSCTKGF